MRLYKKEEEENRRKEDRRKEDRRKEDRRKEDRRKEDRRKGDRRRKEKRRRTLFWLLIIALVSLVLSALTGNIYVFIEKFYKYKDESYRPMDTERMKYETEKANPVGKK